MVTWFFTKVHNGLMRAGTRPPLDRLFTIPRREALKALGLNFPPSSK